MKCFKCDTDNLLNERTNGLCKRCHHHIVFDPRRTADQFNDKQFAKSLILISKTGTLKFTTNQFYYFINARAPKQTAGKVVLVIFLFAVFSTILGPLFAKESFLVFSAIVAILFFACLLYFAFGVGSSNFANLKLTKYYVNNALVRWQNINGNVDSWLRDEKVITDKQNTVPDVSQEVLDYSFDRVVVTQSDEIAMFLIANNFHFENNCAVLSINKYPTALFPFVMKMLQNNADLKVYAVHDASWQGLTMLDKLRNDPNWFKDMPSAQIIDLGLRPRQFGKAKRLILEKVEAVGLSTDLSAPLLQSLEAKEVNWLNNGNLVKLESIAPHRLIRFITLGIAASRDPSQKDALLSVDAGGASGGDGGIYLFSADSFG